MPTAVALIPARGGSQRVPGKNVAPLGGHPLIAYSIAAAREAGVFDAVVVSTDDPATAEIATHYGAELPGLRPAALAGTTSPDIEWVRHTRAVLEEAGRSYELFSILRPTSPFRTAETIRRAMTQLLAHGSDADSIRAVEPCRQHPAKMWVVGEDGFMRPLLDQPSDPVPMHSRQYQALPTVHVQNSSLEIAWTRVLDDPGDIAGRRVLAFMTTPAEGFSVDYPDDLERAAQMAERGLATLPAVPEPSMARP